MPTETFSIVTAPYTFTMETEDGNLVSLIATDDEDNVYDCLIQLMPRNPERGIVASNVVARGRLHEWYLF